MRSLDFSVDLILPTALWPWVDSASNRNEYQKSSLGGGGKGLSALKTDNITAICESIVYKMWERRRLTTQWASTACYRDDFTFFTFLPVIKIVCSMKMSQSIGSGKIGVLFQY
jgi:hypothetical protein